MSGYKHRTSLYFSILVFVCASSNPPVTCPSDGSALFHKWSNPITKSLLSLFPPPVPARPLQAVFEVRCARACLFHSALLLLLVLTLLGWGGEGVWKSAASLCSCCRCSPPSAVPAFLARARWPPGPMHRRCAKLAPLCGASLDEKDLPSAYIPEVSSPFSSNRLQLDTPPAVARGQTPWLGPGWLQAPQPSIVPPGPWEMLPSLPGQEVTPWLYLSTLCHFLRLLLSSV